MDNATENQRHGISISGALGSNELYCYSNPLEKYGLQLYPRVLFSGFCDVFFTFASNPKSQSIPQYIKNITFG